MDIRDFMFISVVGFFIFAWLYSIASEIYCEKYTTDKQYINDVLYCKYCEPTYSIDNNEFIKIEECYIEQAPPSAWQRWFG